MNAPLKDIELVMIAVLGVMLAVFCFVGCSQEIVYREYFEPTEKTLTKTNEGKFHGAIKTEAKKDGCPNWSDNKSLTFKIF